MGTTIHATAVVDRHATLGCNVTIGPFCVIESDVRIGDGCHLASRVVVKEGTTLGRQNDIAEGVVLGGNPQHLKYDSGFGRLVIGQKNTIRENATVHRGLTESCTTILGDDNLVMVNVHVAHDCQVGSHTIIANNVIMAGHVTVNDFAYLSGAVAIHQFCRVGAHAMVGGQAHIKKDVPPYVTVDGQTSRIVGVNVIGLRRRGFDSQAIAQLKAAYRTIFRQGLRWADVLTELEAGFRSGPAADFHPFLVASQRGVLTERRTPASATVPVTQTADSGDENEGLHLRRLAG